MANFLVQNNKFIAGIYARVHGHDQIRELYEYLGRPEVEDPLQGMECPYESSTSR